MSDAKPTELDLVDNARDGSEVDLGHDYPQDQRIVEGHMAAQSKSAGPPAPPPPPTPGVKSIGRRTPAPENNK